MVNRKRLIHASWLMKQISFTIVRSNAHLLLKFENGGHETKEFNERTTMDTNESYDKTDTQYESYMNYGPFVTKWHKKPWWMQTIDAVGQEKKMLIVFFLFNNGGQRNFEPLEKTVPSNCTMIKFFSLALGSSHRLLTPPQQSFIQKRTHFQSFCSKFKDVWGGGRSQHTFDAHWEFLFVVCIPARCFWTIWLFNSKKPAH